MPKSDIYSWTPGLQLILPCFLHPNPSLLTPFLLRWWKCLWNRGRKLHPAGKEIEVHSTGDKKHSIYNMVQTRTFQCKLTQFMLSTKKLRFSQVSPMKSKLDSPCNVLIWGPHPSLSLWILHNYKKHPLSPALLLLRRKSK